ncbi:MAG: ABC transporter permease [Acidobacteria bacterium]|nr:ABC transporter permease [Acidobacteriota bacterium]
MRQWQITIRALRLLLRYRLRSLLLMLSAALGVAGVICPSNYGAGGARQILDQIRRLGTNVLIITPAQSRVVAGRARTGAAVNTLVERDYVAIQKQLPSRLRSSALVTQSFWMKVSDLSKNAPVVGCEPDYFAIKDWPLATGEVFGAADERASARVVLLGHTVATELFGPVLPVGRRILINRVPFTVIGVLAERGQGLDVSNEDNEVYVPLTTAMRRLMNVDHFSGIILEIAALNHMDEAALQARNLLRQLHHIQPSQPEDFAVQNQKSLLDAQQAASARLGFFLRWIAATTLGVSGLGIVAITWIAVKERTREFGTRRALGATRGDIFFQCAVEISALASAGALLGLVISLPLTDFIRRMAGLPFVFDRDTAWIALGAAGFVNLALAFLPSRKAASVSPMEALRYE